MVKDIFRVLLSGMVLSLGLMPVMAQTPASKVYTSHSTMDTSRRPFYLTVGGLIPFSGNTVKLGSVAYTAVGLSYFPTRSAIPAQKASGSRLGLRADYVRGQSNLGEVYSMGISPVYQRVGGTFRRNPVLYGVSLGIFNTHARESATETQPKKSDSSFGLGARLFAGMEIRDNILVEVSYSELPGAMGARPRGFGLQIGSRF